MDAGPRGYGMRRHDGSIALPYAEILVLELKADSVVWVESQDALSWNAAVKQGTK